MALSAKIEQVQVVQVEDENAFTSRISQFSSGTHAEYSILVMFDKEAFTVKKRFSEFATLHDTLATRFNLSFDLPAKTPIRFFNADKLENRKDALNAYLKELCRRQDISSSAEVRSFFRLQGAASPSEGQVKDVQSAAPPQAHSSLSQPQRPPNGVAGLRQDDEDDLIGWDN
jgi:hypothetical protein